MRLLLVLLCQLVWLSSATAQTKQDFNGFWWTDDRSGIIELIVSEQGIEGITRWGDKPDTDRHNPEPELRSRSVKDITFLWGFSYDAKNNRWFDGQVYDPKNGKTYSAKLEIDGSGNTLEMRGYIGISLFGRTATFTRVQAHELPADLKPPSLPN